LIILSALIVAFITLLVERTIKNRADFDKAEASSDSTSADSNEWESQFDSPIPYDITAPSVAEYDTQSEEGGEEPKGLYNPRGNIGWDSYTNDRLAAELHRCSSFEQDLVFLVMELTGQIKVSDSLYSLFADEAVNLFSLRDLIFGKGDNGIAIIMPNADLNEGITKSERFHSRIISKLRELNGSKGGAHAIELNIGLSSRSGRLIQADRLILEANSALEKAIADPVTYIVAFRSDPEKYREFIKSNKN